MSKEKLRHRGARTSHDLIRNIQSGIDRLREVTRVRQNQRDWEHRNDFPFAGDNSMLDEIPQDQEIVLFDIKK